MNKKGKKIVMGQASGFTLIEAVIYIALLGIILGSFVRLSYDLIQASSKMNHEINIANETDFILKKISYYINSADEIIFPEEGRASPILRVKIESETVELSFDSDKQSLIYKNGIVPDLALNTEILKIDSMLFDHSVNRVKVEIIINGELYELVKILK